MADRYDWDRGRDMDRERDYGRGGDRGRGDDRGMVSRGADEVRSWFGDDEARRRRKMDDQRDRQFDRQRDYGANSESVRREHGWGGDRHQSGSSDWNRGAYGDQRDFVSRGNEWGGSTQYSPRGRDWYDPGYDRPGSRWQGGARDYGDEDAGRRQDAWRYSGSNYAGGQTNPGFSGGYGTGNYDSGNYPGGGGTHAAYRGFGSQSGSGPRQSGFENYGSSGTSRYGADSPTTGEGRWGDQGNSANYSAGGGFSGGSFSTGTFAGRGPRNYQRSDERVREDVNERLTADPRVDASEIDVRVQNGEVTLSGTVDDRRTRRLAEEIIEDMPGVRDVHNELRVNKGSWFGSNKDDSQHQRVGEQSRNREDGAIGHTGNPQQRDDVTTINTKDAGKNR